MNNNPIGIFDSGVGGLSIVSEIKKLLPLETITYVADQAYMPYGGKPQDEITERATKIASFLTEKGAKTIVVACNTATVMALDGLRKQFSIPIIGTVPVIKTIAENTKTGKIAVFATPATSKSEYLERLISEFAAGKTVFKVGESHLEDIIEEGNLESEEIDTILREQLNPLLEQNVDAIALGCTHYPFVKNKIESIVGNNVGVFDSGGAIARRLKQVLEHEDLLSGEKGEDVYYTTGDKKKFEGTVAKLTGEEIEAEDIHL